MLLLIGLSLVITEKLHITNFYTRSADKPATQDIQKSDTPSANPTNTIDFSKAKPEDTTTVPDKATTPLTSPSNPELNATITSTRPNSANTTYLIKVAVTGTDNGSCTAVMTKGSKTYTTQSGISLSGSQYSCTDLGIPLSQLNESGSWRLDITVTDKEGATFSTSKEVIL